MIKIAIYTKNDEEEGDNEVHNIATERTHWEGDSIGPDISCDILVKMFANLLSGQGYMKGSIRRSLIEAAEELEDEIQTNAQLDEDENNES